MKFVGVAFALGLFFTVPGMILLRWIGLESVVQRVPVWLLPEGRDERMTVLFLVQFFVALCVVEGLVLVLVLVLLRMNPPGNGELE